MEHPLEIKEFNVNTLTNGETTRICHEDCVGFHNDRTLSVTRTYRGLLYNCYRCHQTGHFVIGHTPRSASQWIRDQKRAMLPYPDYFSVPQDCIPIAYYKGKSVPKRVYNYLYNYGMDEYDLYKFNVLYSPKFDVIIFPIYGDNDTLIGWVGRNLKWKKEE